MIQIRPIAFFALIFAAGCGIGACTFHAYWCQRYEEKLWRLDRDLDLTRQLLDREAAQRQAQDEGLLVRQIIHGAAIREIHQIATQHRTEPEPVERIPPAMLPPLPLPPVVTDPEDE